MKVPYPYTIIRFVLVSLLFLTIRNVSFAQGRVVINEYMPWTASTCGGPTAEFIELLNFGPGPLNIGCYIVTDGDYSITIPPNTILQPGAFYVLSGQSVIAGPCANIDSTVHPQLNWNTCNCTSAAIPTTGDGLMTDGGSANEQVVLLDPNLNVMDAVARSLPVESSSTITTSTIGGQCTAKTFNLDSMAITYESIGESAGRGNSFARKLDGDCGWLKDPQQSANATNNTPGATSDVNYSFNITKAQTCSGNGSVAVTVTTPDYSVVFPMTYILAFDSNGDGIFDLSDSYTYGTVTNPNTVAISNLVAGMYRLTVASVKGCFLHTFPFSILSCFPLLPIRLMSFEVYQNSSSTVYHWSITNTEDLDYVVLEAGTDGLNFVTYATTPYTRTTNEVWNYSVPLIISPSMKSFRICIYSKHGEKIISPVVTIGANTYSVNRTWPNPARDRLYGQYLFSYPGTADYMIYNLSQELVSKGELPIRNGMNTFSLSVEHLPSATYQLIMVNRSHAEETIRFRFLKL
jgi:hypothetical protein